MLADEAIDLISLDRAELRRQWDEMSDEKWDALLIDVREEFDLDDDDLEQKVEQTFESAFEILEQMDKLRKTWMTAA